MTVLIIAIVAVLLAALLAGFLIYLYRRPNYFDLVPNPRTGIEQYIVKTPAGLAVVTKILHDTAGWSYKIETSFRDEPTRIWYVAPSTAVVQRTLRGLVVDHETRSIA